MSETGTVNGAKYLEDQIEALVVKWNAALEAKDKMASVYEHKIYTLATKYKEVTGHFYYRDPNAVRE